MRTRACGGFMSFTPPPPRGLILIHTCQTVLNPGASRSRVPSHHADKISCDHVDDRIFCEDAENGDCDDGTYCPSFAVCLHVPPYHGEHARVDKTDNILITHW